MKCGVLLFLAMAAVAMPAWARLGETTQECEARYGQHTGEMPGSGEVKSIRVYRKENTEVTAFFTGKGSQPATVSMIFYRVGTNTAQRQNSRPYSDEEIKTLLATVNGTWADYTNPTLSAPKAINSFASRPPTATQRMQPVTSQIEQRRAETFNVVKKTGELMYPMIFTKPGVAYLKVTDLGHVGNTCFAFRMEPSSSYTRDAVALVSYDAVPALQEWVTQQHLVLDAKPAPPPRNLSGF